MQAGRTPFHPRSGQPAGDDEDEGGASPLALPAPGAFAAAGRSPGSAGGLGAATPMTDTARRIMMALDAMTSVTAFCQGPALQEHVTGASCQSWRHRATAPVLA